MLFHFQADSRLSLLDVEKDELFHCTSYNLHLYVKASTMAYEAWRTHENFLEKSQAGNPSRQGRARVFSSSVHLHCYRKAHYPQRFSDAKIKWRTITIGWHRPTRWVIVCHAMSAPEKRCGQWASQLVAYLAKRCAEKHILDAKPTIINSRLRVISV